MSKVEYFQVEHAALQRRIKASEAKGIRVSAAAYKALAASKRRMEKAQAKAKVKSARPPTGRPSDGVAGDQGRQLQIIINPDNFQSTGWLEARTYAEGGGEVRRQSYNVLQCRWSEGAKLALSTPERRQAERAIQSLGFTLRDAG